MAIFLNCLRSIPVKGLNLDLRPYGVEDSHCLLGVSSEGEEDNAVVMWPTHCISKGLIQDWVVPIK